MVKRGVLAATVILALASIKPLLTHMAKEHVLVQEKAKAIAISYYLPHFPYLAGVVMGLEKPQANLMESYYDGKPYIFITYYGKAVELFPDNDSARMLLAFCQYHHGDKAAAQAQYVKGLQLNPYFFWGYYNLGIIYFENGQYEQSAAMFAKALSLDSKITLEIIHQDTFYRQIWRYVSDPPQTLERHLGEGRENAALFLKICYLKAKGGHEPDGLTQALVERMKPQLF